MILARFEQPYSDTLQSLYSTSFSKSYLLLSTSHIRLQYSWQTDLSSPKIKWIQSIFDLYIFSIILKVSYYSKITNDDNTFSKSRRAFALSTSLINHSPPFFRFQFLFFFQFFSRFFPQQQLKIEKTNLLQISNMSD